jgi:hypothetical protein
MSKARVRAPCKVTRRLTECAKGPDPDLLSVGWVATACAIHAVSCSPPTVELLSALDCITAEFAF